MKKIVYNPAGTPRQIDDITSIRQKPNFGEFSRRSHVLFPT